MEGNANRFELMKLKWSLISEAAKKGYREQVDRLLEEVGEAQQKVYSLSEIAEIADSNLEYLEEYKSEFLRDE